MRTALIVPHLLLPRAQIDLGWLVLNKSSPTQDFHALPAPTDSVATERISDLLARSVHQTNTNFRTQLTKHLAASLGAHSDLAIELSAAEAQIYHFRNSQEWYESQRLGLGTKQWLERAIANGLNVYVVVGLYTLRDVHVSSRTHKDAKLAGQSRVDIASLAAMGLAAVATATPGIGANMVDVAVGVRGITNREREQSFMVVEELVYAVQYRKIKFKWFSSRCTDRSFLERGNRWQVVWELRGRDGEGDEDDEDDDEEDVVEALIADEDEQDPGEAIVAGNDVFVFL